MSMIIMSTAIFVKAEEETENDVYEYTFERDEKYEELKDKWNIDDSYISDDYSSGHKWDGSEHRKCVDDDKKLERQELLRSVALGQHSFRYRHALNVSGLSTIYDGAILNMNELLYFITCDIKCDIIGYTYIDVSNDGEKELVYRVESGMAGGYVIFYTDNDNVYVTILQCQAISNLKTDGTFMFTANELGNYMCLTGKNPRVVYGTHMLFFEADGSYDGIVVINGQEAENEQFEEYEEQWRGIENCVTTEYTKDNINKTFN